MNKDKTAIKAEKLPDSGNVDQEISRVLSKSEKAVLVPTAVAGSIGLGFGGSVLGAVMWYLVAAIFNLQIVYLAVLVGVFVGYGMKVLLKNTNSLSLGLVAAGLALFGLLLGNALIWYFQVPNWTRESLVADYGWTETEAEEISNEEIRKEYGLGEYFKDDLTSFEDGHNAVYSWVAYAFAVFIGFGRVFNFKNPNKSI